METLELKHIAPYLPYGLKVDLSYYDDEEPQIVNGIPDYSNINIDGGKASTYGARIIQEYSIDKIKPILRPLSDLTEEINIKNDVFIPVEYFEIGDDDSGTEYDNGNIKTIEKLIDISKYNCFHDIHYLPFSLVQQLLEWHFDIYGLIDKKLAIDINTLNN